jgi:nucleotide-binding universal stress UspA family protein
MAEEGAARTVLIAVDQSGQAKEAFSYYMEALHRPENYVILLHCPELSNVSMRMSKGSGAPYEEWEKIMKEEQGKWEDVQKQYESLLSQNNVTGKFAVEPTGKPGEAIVKYAEEKKVTMVIMGTRGLGSIRRTIMGSVSDYVVHHAHCPVIVCRPKK